MRGRGRGSENNDAPKRGATSAVFLGQVKDRFPQTYDALLHVFDREGQYTLQNIEDGLAEYALDSDYEPKVTPYILQALVQEKKLRTDVLRICKRCGSARDVVASGDTFRCTNCRIVFGETGEYDIFDTRYLGADKDELHEGGQAWSKPVHELSIEKYALAADAVMTNMRVGYSKVQPMPAESLQYLLPKFGAKDATIDQMLLEMTERGLCESEPMRMCNNCNMATIGKRMFRRDQKLDVYDEDPQLFYCTKCKRIDATGLEIAEHMQIVGYKQSKNFMQDGKPGYRLTERGIDHINAVRDLGESIEAENAIINMENGSLNVEKNERALLAKYQLEDERTHWGMKSGSPSRIWGESLKRGWINQEQYDAALKKHSHRWNWAGD